jgi:hypothetical protein
MKRATTRVLAARRSFLKAVGAGAATLPFFKMLEDSAVNAQAAAPPQRFIGIYHPHGIAFEHWTRRAGETDTSFNLEFPGSSLAPFGPFKDKIITFEGLDNAVGIESNTAAHGAAVCMLTGTGGTGNDKKPVNLSIDQFLAREKQLGSDTRFPTIELAVGADGKWPDSTISYAAGGEPLAKIIDPLQTFDTFYAGLMVGSDPAALAAAARRRRRGQSVIDFIKADAARLQPRLAPPERVKLDQHLTAVREIERRLTMAEPQTCVVPTKPVRSEVPATEYFNGGLPYLDKITDLQVDMLAQAMICGLTRFSTLVLSDPGYRVTDGVTRALEVDVHNDVAHKYNVDAANGTESQQRLARLNLYYFQKIARLMQKLADASLLDSTLILTFSDMGNPSAHSMRNVPFMLLGGASGKLRMGRRLVYAADCPPDNMWCNPPTTVSHNALLVSICNVFGVAIDAYGRASNPAFTKGPLPQLA